MMFLFTALLPFAVCVVLIFGTSAIWWRNLQTPWLFVVVGFLSLLGVHSVVQVIAEARKVARSTGYILESQTTAATVQLVEKSLTVETVVTSVAVALLGFPLLLWLKRALPAL